MRRIIAGALALALLAGCDGGTQAPGMQAQALAAARAALKARGAAAQAQPQPTRAGLDQLDGAWLEVTRERTGQVAYLYVNQTRRDDDPGQITLWRTQDDATLALRNGVLIATRGFGGDILSGSARVSGDRPGPVSGGERVLFLRTPNHEQTRLSLACDLADLGESRIEIVQRAHTTRHLRETCQGGGGIVTNDYWIEPRAGLMRQSRQWAGPHIGYLRLRQLTE